MNPIPTAVRLSPSPQCGEGARGWGEIYFLRVDTAAVSRYA